jgi:protein-serine/threonine kinase
MAETPIVENIQVPHSPINVAPPAPAPPASNRRPPPMFPGTLSNRAPGVSTSKSKKVMDWFRKKSLVDQIDETSIAGGSPAAPQVVVTGDRELAAVPAGPAPPSSWTGPRSATTVLTNGTGLLHPSLSVVPSARGTASASVTPITSTYPPTDPGPASFNRAAIRVHEGPVDPGAVSSGSPDEIYAQVIEVLRGMGVTFSPETMYKAQCIRPKQRKDGSRQSGLAAFALTGLGGSGGVSFPLRTYA